MQGGLSLQLVAHCLDKGRFCSDAVKILLKLHVQDMSLFVRKTAFCICENKDADQLRDNREADQPLCFRYIDSTILLLSKSEISSL